MNGRGIVAFATACIVAVSAPAQATPIREDARLVQGPPPSEITSPYEPALRCIATQLTERQRNVVFSPGNFPDQTGRLNYVADSGVGSFSTQGVDSMIFSSLALAGVSVADATPIFRNGTDWTLNRLAGSGADISIRFPDVVISGAITTLDFLPGGGGEVNIAGIRLGHRESRILVGIDARAVIAARPNATSAIDGPAGSVIASTRLQKQIVGYDDGAGGAGFVGPRNSPLFLSVDLGRRPREAIQFAQRIMIDLVVAELLIKSLTITGCDEQIQWGHQVANLQ